MDTWIEVLLALGAVCLAVAGFLVAVPLGFTVLSVLCFGGAILLVNGGGQS